MIVLCQESLVCFEILRFQSREERLLLLVGIGLLEDLAIVNREFVNLVCCFSQEEEEEEEAEGHRAQPHANSR